MDLTGHIAALGNASLLDANESVGPLLELFAQVQGLADSSSSSSSSSSTARTEKLKASSKQHVPVITQVLRTLSARLVPGLPALICEQLCHLACSALDALDVLSCTLKASRLDLEVQRYR